jgi:hypothetical protein
LKKFNSKIYPDSWNVYLDHLEPREIAKISLTSKFKAWLCEEPCDWGDLSVFEFKNSDSKALVNSNNKVVAVSIGNGKLAKLCVNTEYHWEQRCTNKLGPGLDWLNKKNWDFRSKETELWEIAITGQIPKNRKMIFEDEESE